MSEKPDRTAIQLASRAVSMAVATQRHPQDLLWEICHASGMTPEDARATYLAGREHLISIRKTLPFVID